MKHLVSVVLCLILALFTATASAQYDYSGMSYADLLVEQSAISRALRDVEPLEGNLIYDYAGIRITFDGLVDKYGPSAKFTIENASKSDIGVSFADVSINDCMMTVLFQSKVMSGKKSIDYMNIMYLDEYGITEIDKIDLKISIFDTKTYKEKRSTENITILP